MHYASTGDYDLIVLDVMLPKRDGWSVVRELRRAGKQTLVLFLTARDEVSERIKGLDLGADDYLVKPFAFSEFMARVRSLVRRGTSRTQEIIHIADLEVDLLHSKASRAGKRIDLTPKEFRLLALLVRNVVVATGHGSCLHAHQ